MRLYLSTILIMLFIAGCGQSEHKNPFDSSSLHKDSNDLSKTPISKEDVKLAEPTTETITETSTPPLEETKAKEDADKVVQSAENSETAKRDADQLLQDAISNREIEKIKQQLATGANVNSKAARGWTPLHLAVESDDIEIVKLLIANGSNVNAKHNGGGTALHWAARKGHREIAELLIANGANVNAQDEDGGTPLFYVSNPEMADLLRKSGANE